MMTILWNVAAFLVALGILIAVHEWGHFWVARRCGVKVLRFSLGLGKVVWSRQGKDGTEYSLSLIPLGGYVKMLDERIETVPEHLKSQAFNRQSLSKRAAIVAAGPAANFVFAIVAFTCVYLLGITSVKPVIGNVVAHSIAAEQGITSGMVIKSVNGHAVSDWEDASYQFVAAVGESDVVLTVETTGVTKDLHLPLTDWSITPEEPLPFKRLGFYPVSPDITREVAQISPNSPAEKAGLQRGDVLVAVNGKKIESWNQISSLIQESPDVTMAFVVDRQGALVNLDLTPQRKESKTKVIGFAGIMPVVKSLPAEYLTHVRYSPIEAFEHGLVKFKDVTALTFDVVGKLLTGAVSVENLSGPVSIAKGAGQSAEGGLVYFVGFLALISVNLGIMNLLPLPVLDGGHLVFFAIEAIIRRPVSTKFQEVAYRMGAAILMCLMAVALFNDFAHING